MSTIFSEEKHGYSKTEVDKHIEFLEKQIEQYKDQSAAISQALISAQVASDTLLKSAEEQKKKILEEAEQEKEKILEEARNQSKSIVSEFEENADEYIKKSASQIEVLKTNITNQKAALESFQKEYEALCSKFLNNKPDSDVSSMTAKLGELEALVSGFSDFSFKSKSEEKKEEAPKAEEAKKEEAPKAEEAKKEEVPKTEDAKKEEPKVEASEPAKKPYGPITDAPKTDGKSISKQDLKNGVDVTIRPVQENAAANIPKPTANVPNPGAVLNGAAPTQPKPASNYGPKTPAPAPVKPAEATTGHVPTNPYIKPAFGLKPDPQEEAFNKSIENAKANEGPAQKPAGIYKVAPDNSLYNENSGVKFSSDKK